MAADLVRQNVDVIVAVGNYPGLLVQKITATIPIVVLSSRGGVETKLYSSLSHPGGNLTGIDNLSPDRDVKRVEFLKEIVPKLSRLAVLYNPLPSYASNHLNSISSAFEKLGIEAQPFEVRSPPEFEVAFASILRKRQDTMIDAMTTVTDPMFVFARKRIVDFGIENKFPNAHEYREWVQIGGLLAYGPTIDGIWCGAHISSRRSSTGQSQVICPSKCRANSILPSTSKLPKIWAYLFLSIWSRGLTS